jgi:phosphotransferase system HPr (HPr) family protein
MQQSAVTRTVVIKNPQGLHARPAELLARRALAFQSQIEVIKDDLRVDAKSILHILTLGASQGTQLVLEARGSDAEEAIETLVALIESQFADGEPKTDHRNSTEPGNRLSGGMDDPSQ